MFKITVPLDDTYSFDFGENEKETADKVPINSEGVPISADKLPKISDEVSLTEQQMMIIKYVQEHGDITSGNAEELLGIKQRRAREILKELVEKKILTKRGAYKSTVYVLAELEE